jgi:arsenite methyltransferase
MSDSSSDSGSRQDMSDSSSDSGSRQDMSDSSSGSGSRQDMSDSSGSGGRRGVTSETTDRDALRHRVRERYAAAAVTAEGGQLADCCGEPTGCCNEEEVFGAVLYDELDGAELPEAALLASLGCGNPTVVADLHEGETVLDLGSGGGIDVLLSARRVGPSGHAYGLDMTDEMLSLARRNAAEAEVDNVTFLKGEIEEIPLDDASVDVVISNCVINLSSDKQAVFEEMRRVLRPLGRIGVSDVIAEDELSPEERAERGSWVGCIAGALSEAEYLVGLRAVGFAEVEVERTHQVADGMHAAIVRARLPG